MKISEGQILALIRIAEDSITYGFKISQSNANGQIKLSARTALLQEIQSQNKELKEISSDKLEEIVLKYEKGDVT